MNKSKKLLIILLFLTGLIYVKGYSQDSIGVKICNTYQTLFETILNGDAASIEKTAWINEFSLIEESIITIYPQRTPKQDFKVVINFINLEKGKYRKSYENNSILGYLLKGCKNVNEEYSILINTSCYFYMNIAEDARDAAKYGITKKIDDDYLIDGDMVKAYSNLCRDKEQNKPQPVKKPAVYLYPLETMDIKVKLFVNGKLTLTEPIYKDEWNVTATKEGLIDNKYDYLFYEADLNKIELPPEGWIVEFGNLDKWFGEYLPKLGLNSKETEQFKEYWLKDLNKSNYYEIKLLDNNFLNENMRLTITPEPQTIIRLNFHFKPLNEKIYIKEPLILKTERNGFTVVEWGGINAGDKKIIP